MAQKLGQVAVGTVVKINENGSPVDFYVAKHDYESGLNGVGRTLVVRKDCYDNRVWNSSNVNAWASCSMRSWLNGTYKNMLDVDIQSPMGTTAYRYTPGNGNNTVTTRSDAVFLLSPTELGKSTTYANVEGSALPIASTLQVAYLNGRPDTQWTRSPSTNGTSYALRISSDGGGIYTGNCTNTEGSRPAFTLPAALEVLSDGTIVGILPPPSTLTVPVQSMQGNQITVSWTAVDGADGYILERKADTDADWTQVYSGANLTYSETVGTWTSVQYRVKAGVSGTYGDYTTSESVPVVSASIVVISGTDGDLGTLTSDVSYTVSSSGTTALTVVETINGIARTFTAVNGATNKISVIDLSTGTGTITIQASTNPGSGDVTVTREWTYTKAAPTFVEQGSLAQLTQQGQNIWAKTIAEAVRTPGIWGGNLGLALSKLAQAMFFDPDSGAVEDIMGGTIPMVSIETGSYVGTGTAGPNNPTTLTFENDVKLVLVGVDSGYWWNLFLVDILDEEYKSHAYSFLNGENNENVYAKYSQKTLSWYYNNASSGYAAQQCNRSGLTYHYVAFGISGIENYGR